MLYHTCIGSLSSSKSIRTCESVYGLTPWKEFWGWSSADFWPGEFVLSTNRGNHAETLSKDMINDLPKIVRELMFGFRQDPETIYHKFINLFIRWCRERPIEIFCRICFCASSSSTLSFDSNRTQNNSSPNRRRRRQGDLLIMQYRLMTRRLDSDDCDSVECQTCYQKLYNAWDKPLISTSHSTTTPTASQADRDASKCAKCSDDTHDSLLVPPGYRGFCDSCGRSAALLLPVMNDNQ